MDKSSENVFFVYQKHHAHVQVNERGLNNVNKITSTYTKATKPIDKIVTGNT